MWLTKSFATQFPVSSKVCSLYFGYGRAKSSDVLADILRELGILCLPGKLAPNVAPTRTRALQHAAPSPRLLLSPSCFPSRTKIKKNWLQWAPWDGERELQSCSWSSCCHRRGAGTNPWWEAAGKGWRGGLQLLFVLFHPYLWVPFELFLCFSSSAAPAVTVGGC